MKMKKTYENETATNLKATRHPNEHGDTAQGGC